MREIHIGKKSILTKGKSRKQRLNSFKVYLFKIQVALIIRDNIDKVICFDNVIGKKE